MRQRTTFARALAAQQTKDGCRIASGFVVEAIFSGHDGDRAVYATAHYVGGFMRGSHIGPLMPVKRATGCSYFDGPPIVSALGFCVKDGKLTDPVDLFDHPFWDEVRRRAAVKAMEIRRQGFSGPAMLSYSELEYGGIVNILERLDKRFKNRAASQPAEPALA